MSHEGVYEGYTSDETLNWRRKMALVYKEMHKDGDLTPYKLAHCRECCKEVARRTLDYETYESPEITVYQKMLKKMDGEYYITPRECRAFLSELLFCLTEEQKKLVRGMGRFFINVEQIREFYNSFE